MNENFPYIRNLPLKTRLEAPAATRSDFEEFFLAVRRQGLLVATMALLGLFLGAFHYATSPKEYYAGATVLIEQRQNDLTQEIAAAVPVLRNDTALQNEVQILSSLELASTVVRQLDLDSDANFLNPPSSVLGGYLSDLVSWTKSWIPAAPDAVGGSAGSVDAGPDQRILETAALLRNRTTFTRVGRSFSVEIGYLSHDPALATAIANAYADAYLADGTQAKFEASERTAAWMRDRIEELRLSAAEASREAEEFRAENGAIDQQGLRERDQRAASLNNLFLTIQSKYEQIALEGSFPVSNGRILSRAIAPKSAAAPKAWQILAAGLALGGLIGLAIAVFREFRETGFRSGQDVREVAGVAFLGYLPVLRRKKIRMKKWSKTNATEVEPAHMPDFISARRPSAPKEHADQVTDQMAELWKTASLSTQRSGQAVSIPSDLFACGVAPGSHTDTLFRNLLTTLEMELEGDTGRVVAVGAVADGEGATTTAVNLANLAALCGYRTILVDGDLRNSSLADRLGISRGPGTLAVLEGTVDLHRATQRLPYSGLDVLTTGADAKSGKGFEPSRLPRFADLIASLRLSYDLVIIDMPPLSQRPEAKSLLRS